MYTWYRIIHCTPANMLIIGANRQARHGIKAKISYAWIWFNVALHTCRAREKGGNFCECINTTFLIVARQRRRKDISIERQPTFGWLSSWKPCLPERVLSCCCQKKKRFCVSCLSLTSVSFFKYKIRIVCFRKQSAQLFVFNSDFDNP